MGMAVHVSGGKLLTDTNATFEGHGWNFWGPETATLDAGRLTDQATTAAAAAAAGSHLDRFAESWKTMDGTKPAKRSTSNDLYHGKFQNADGSVNAFGQKVVATCQVWKGQGLRCYLDLAHKTLSDMWLPGWMVGPITLSASGKPNDVNWNPTVHALFTNQWTYTDPTTGGISKLINPGLGTIPNTSDYHPDRRGQNWGPLDLLVDFNLQWARIIAAATGPTLDNVIGIDWINEPPANDAQEQAGYRQWANYFGYSMAQSGLLLPIVETSLSPHYMQGSNPGSDAIFDPATAADFSVFQNHWGAAGAQWVGSFHIYWYDEGDSTSRLGTGTTDTYANKKANALDVVYQLFQAQGWPLINGENGYIEQTRGAFSSCIWNPPAGGNPLTDMNQGNRGGAAGRNTQKIWFSNFLSAVTADGGMAQYTRDRAGRLHVTGWTFAKFDGNHIFDAAPTAGADHIENQALNYTTQVKNLPKTAARLRADLRPAPADMFAALFATGDTTAPTTPTISATHPNTLDGGTISWSGATDAVGVTGYKVYKDGVMFQDVGNVLTYTFTGQAGGVAFGVTVRAYDAAGNLSVDSNSVTLTPTGGGSGDTTPPTAPTGLTLVANTVDGASISWTQGTDAVGVTKNRLYRGATGANQLAPPDGEFAAATSHTITGLAAGTYQVWVTAVDAAGNESTKVGPLTIAPTGAPVPSVATVAVSSGGGAGNNAYVGDTVTLTGANLSGVTGVTVNGVAMTSVSVVDAAHVTAVVPTGAGAGGQVVLQPSGAVSSQNLNIHQPTVTALPTTPPHVGDTISIVGDGFFGLSGAAAVKIGGTNATSYTVVDQQHINAVVPAAAIGTGRTVQITTASGTVTSVVTMDVVQAAPTISPTGLSATTGPPGTVVTLTGTGFTGASAASVGGINAPTFAVTNDTTMTVTIPNNAVTGKIGITTPGGSALSTQTFTVISLVVLNNPAFSPTHGAPGAAVSIFGSGFNGVVGAGGVKFNGGTLNATSYTVVSDTRIDAVVPAGVLNGTIRVTKGGQSADSATSFRRGRSTRH